MIGKEFDEPILQRVIVDVGAPLVGALNGAGTRPAPTATDLAAALGIAACEPAEAALANAAALIERTRARTLAPALCEWRAELAAAKIGLVIAAAAG